MLTLKEVNKIILDSPIQNFVIRVEIDEDNVAVLNMYYHTDDSTIHVDNSDSGINDVSKAKALPIELTKPGGLEEALINMFSKVLMWIPNCSWTFQLSVGTAKIVKTDQTVTLMDGDDVPLLVVSHRDKALSELSVRVILERLFMDLEPYLLNTASSLMEFHFDLKYRNSTDVDDDRKMFISALHSHCQEKTIGLLEYRVVRGGRQREQPISIKIDLIEGKLEVFVDGKGRSVGIPLDLSIEEIRRYVTLSVLNLDILIPPVIDPYMENKDYYALQDKLLSRNYKLKRKY